MMLPSPNLPRVAITGLALWLSVSLAACGGEGSDAAGESANDAPPTAEEIRAASPPSDTSEASASVSGSGTRSGASVPASGGSPTGAPPDPDRANESGEATPVELGGPPYAVQLGAFRREANARALRESLEEAGLPVWTATIDAGVSGAAGAARAGGGADSPATLLRVRVGATSTVADARRLVELIRGRVPDVPSSAWIAPLGSEVGETGDMMQTTSTLLEDG